ncbi:XrtA/PEP-CTERM system TPR-repeat protein PrsT [Thalassotalea sp. SU-HH00458]|uniref:XrtA/PEP-CTERM system TPR-repeat protein PrsT n=1 Tax=Thalassotalea sp. SU-HH00458 TaxID=3127657 RepID=UPI0033654065
MKINNIYFLIILLLIFILNGCSQNKTVDDYILSAEEYVEKHQVSSAIVELKNAVRLDPRHPKVRFLLGSLYLKSGEAASAQKELALSLELNGNERLIIPQLLKSMYMQGKNDELIEMENRIKEFSSENQVVVYIYSSIAFMEQKNDVNAKISLEKALDISSDSIYKRLGKAYFELHQSNLSAATQVLEEVLNQNDDFSEAIFLLGQLQYMEENYYDAIETLNKYKTIQPSDFRVNFIIAQAMLKNRNYSGAEEQILPILSLAPDHALGNKIKGISRYYLSDYELAKLHLDKSIQNGLNDSESKLMAGISAYQLGKYESAYNYLNSLSDQFDTQHPIYKLTQSLSLILSYSDKNKQALASIAELTQEDAKILTLTSIELLKIGKKNEAKQIFKHVSKVKDLNTSLIDKHAVLKKVFDMPGADDELDRVLIDSPENMTVNIFHITTLVREGDYDNAILAAKKLVEAKPEDLLSNLLIASIYRKTGSSENALKYYLKAGNINSSNVSYFLYESELAENRGDIGEAIIYIEKALEKSPDNISLLATHLELSVKSGNSDNSLKPIAESMKRRPFDPHLTLLYSKALFINKKYSEVIALLAETPPEKGNNYDLNYWLFVGESYLRLNKVKEAIEFFTLWTKYEPFNDKSWLTLSLTLERLKNNDVLDVVNNGLKRNEQSTSLKLMKVKLLLDGKAYESAETLLSTFTKKQQSSARYKGLYGRLLLSKGASINAIENLKAYYDVYSEPKYAVFITAAYYSLKKFDVGTAFMEKHLVENEADLSSQMFLAMYLTKIDRERAIYHYNKIVDNHPKNIIAINNLAWILFEEKQYTKAEALIERAIEIAPNTPAILDTAGMIKVQLGKKNESIDLFRKAHQLDPTNSEIEAHYRNITK